PLDRDWDGPQDDRWSELAELGWLDVAEADLGFVEEALLLEELGYACYPGPFLAHVLALPALSPEDRTAAASGETRWSVEVGGLAPARRHVRRRRACALPRLLGRVVRRDRRRAGARRRRRREGVRRGSRRRRVRAVDPGARRHRLHVGAPAAPLLQARAVARGL